MAFRNGPHKDVVGPSQRWRALPDTDNTVDSLAEALCESIQKRDTIKVQSILLKRIPQEVIVTEVPALDSERHLTALHYAVEQSDEQSVDILKLLLQESLGNEALETISQGEVDRGRLSKRVGSKPLLDFEGYTPLCWACLSGNINAVRALLLVGADPNSQKSFEKTTPLIAVSSRNIKTRSRQDYTNESRIVTALLNAGADVTLQDANGCTALHYLLAQEHQLTTARLILAKATKRIDLSNKNGWTLLHCCASYVWSEEVESCIRSVIKNNDAATEARNKYDQTPLSLALMLGNKEAAAVLREVPRPEKSRDRRHSSSPYRNVFNEQIQAANNSHMNAGPHSSVNSISRGLSPFRQGSPFAAHLETLGPASAHLGSTAQIRERQKVEEDAITRRQHQYRAEEEVTLKTISPKDAALDYHESEEDAKMPLFPDESMDRAFEGLFLNRSRSRERVVSENRQDIRSRTVVPKYSGEPNNTDSSSSDSTKGPEAESKSRSEKPGVYITTRKGSNGNLEFSQETDQGIINQMNSSGILKIYKNKDGSFTTRMDNGVLEVSKISYDYITARMDWNGTIKISKDIDEHATTRMDNGIPEVSRKPDEFTTTRMESSRPIRRHKRGSNSPKQEYGDHSTQKSILSYKEDHAEESKDKMKVDLKKTFNRKDSEMAARRLRESSSPIIPPEVLLVQGTPEKRFLKDDTIPLIENWKQRGATLGSSFDLIATYNAPCVEALLSNDADDWTVAKIYHAEAKLAVGSGQFHDAFILQKNVLLTCIKRQMRSLQSPIDDKALEAAIILSITNLYVKNKIKPAELAQSTLYPKNGDLLDSNPWIALGALQRFIDDQRKEADSNSNFEWITGLHTVFIYGCLFHGYSQYFNFTPPRLYSNDDAVRDTISFYLPFLIEGDSRCRQLTAESAPVIAGAVILNMELSYGFPAPETITDTIFRFVSHLLNKGFWTEAFRIMKNPRFREHFYASDMVKMDARHRRLVAEMLDNRDLQ